jgi:hypothetical protein
MRFLATVSTAVLAAGLLAGGALASPAAPGAVQVSIGPQLQSHAREVGQRELDALAIELRRDVENQLEANGGRTEDVARVDLVITAATPNRPTMEQMSRTPGLSFASFSVGGATIEGTVTTADGATRPVRYHYMESDIRQARHAGTWEDAERTFDMFAHDLAHGRAYASR